MPLLDWQWVREEGHDADTCCRGNRCADLPAERFFEDGPPGPLHIERWDRTAEDFLSANDCRTRLPLKAARLGLESRAPRVMPGSPIPAEKGPSEIAAIRRD